MAEEQNTLENERAGDQSSVALDEQHGNRTVRVLRGVDWADVDDRRLDLLGYAYVDGGEIIRYLPAVDADRPLQVCVRVETRGRSYIGEYDREEDDKGLLQTANYYQFADLVCTFETVPYDLGELEDGTTSQLGASVDFENERFATYLPRPGVDFVTAKAGDFVWDYKTVGATIPFPIPELIPFADSELILYQWPVDAYPKTAIRDCLGRVNGTALALPQRPTPWDDAPEETLQLVGVIPEPGYFPDDTQFVNIHYYFRERTLEAAVGGGQGWNVFPAPDGQGYRVSRKAASSIGPFQVADFQALMRPEP